MRTSVGILGGIVLLLIGFVTLSSAAQNSRDAAVVNGTNQSANVWNTTTQVLQNAGQASGGLVYVAVFVLIAGAMGLLVWVGTGGR